MLPTDGIGGSVQTWVVAALPLMGVLIGAALQYAFGKILEGRKQLILQRAQAYTDFFGALAALANARKSEEQLVLAANAKTRICIYGSGVVVKRLTEFSKTGSTTATNTGRAALAALVQAMRKDVAGRGLRIPNDDFQHLLFGSRSKDH